MESMNCWDFMKCPELRREQCRAYLEDRGTECWIVTGTMCRGELQPDLETKLSKCRECNFYKHVVFGKHLEHSNNSSGPF